MKDKNYDKYLEGSAVRYLKDKGYKIRERNFKTRFGEIDIIAEDKDTICFVEVKARSFPYKYEPFEAVDRKKIERLINVASYYLKSKQLKLKKARFDVLSIVKFKEAVEFLLIKEAFSPEG